MKGINDFIFEKLTLNKDTAKVKYPKGVFPLYTDMSLSPIDDDDKIIGVGINPENAEGCEPFGIINKQIPLCRFSNSSNIANAFAGQKLITTESAAFEHFDGYDDTQRILNALGNDAIAINKIADIAKEFNIYDSYIPSIGEWKVIFSYRKEIDNILGSTSSFFRANYYASSTPADDGSNIFVYNPLANSISKAATTISRPLFVAFKL